MFDTENEINAQPRIWAHWAQEHAQSIRNIRDWIIRRAPEEIWFCGAGTSAFIGNTLADALNRDAIVPACVRAVATTDLVCTPHLFLPANKRVLVVSFGRSGNSSETVGTLDLLEKRMPQADWLQITCNAQSDLATRKHPGPGERQALVLPEACHDAGFAMTSSFSTMLLSALLCLTPQTGTAQTITTLSNAGARLLAMPLDYPMPARAVFLGAGPLTGLAREAALKVLELTAGAVVSTWDSTLGFRHGPKAIMNDETTVFVFLSTHPLTRRYDDDIVAEIKAQFPRARVIGIGPALSGATPPDICFEGVGKDEWNAVLHVLVAQRLSVLWSKTLGLNVDNPFIDHGNLTRVVADVRLYS